ncbi:methyl-accepting chemotaxis protein [Vitreimonas flagellata]|uniref:methyl-accepting chemotaxis protein n=1 Tax=Vitreimonas flagellata TaxID=2560861 RepID=UPI001074DC80|nr:methyl-accepting chemotaxis protein [Vitreimonas flagellata]
MSLDNLKISRKLIIAFALLIITSVAASTLVFLGLNDLESKIAQVDAVNERTLMVQGAYTQLVEQQSVMRGYAMDGDASRLEDSANYAQVFDERITAFRDATLNPEQRERAERLIGMVAEFRATIDQGVALVANPATRAQGADIISGARLGDMRTLVQEIVTTQEEMLVLRGEEQQAAVAAEKMVLLIGGALTVIIAFAMGWLLSRSIATPVTQMTATMGKLAAGDNNVDIPGVGRKDEIGDMAAAVQGFKDAAIEKIRMEGEAAAQRAAAEAERARNEEAQKKSAAEQAIVVSGLADGLTQLSSGNLTYRITRDFPGEYKKLQDDFNDAMSQLMETMKVISAASQGIRSGAGEMSGAADDLSKRTEQQAASLEETAAALDEITATVKRAADGSRQAHAAAANARTDAEEGGEVMRGAIAAMQAIEQSSSQIAQIIGVIDEIAFQTNLLALNAGVEAARAGDAGRGFAVVASEVRALAQRSAEAAKEIKGLISKSTEQVESGAKLVGDTGASLQRIIGRVAEINELVREIASSAEEQAVGLSQVNTAVNQMDQGTQQNAAMVEESTAASHALAHEARELANLVAKFNIGNEPLVETYKKPAASKPAAKPAAARPAAVKPATPAPARAPAMSGNNALAPSADWEEF